ncbi:MAG: RdgB/HAM1 family non-canonical purine NTP pyrophosphatase [Planctomycetota bacterium]|nr:RdgB/HAM1 family non-canonical purine NTP pyrophosphatase [Planctomycetota bacterium]
MLPRFKILLASRNPGKVREIASTLAPLGIQVVSLDQIDPNGRISAPAEDGETFAENARNKADYYARQVSLPALADDSGLLVDALGGAPGVRSARFAQENFPPQASQADIDKANNTKLISALNGIDESKRTARFVCCLALSDGQKILAESSGAIEGVIARLPHGNNGFGYDPLFFIPDLGLTAAELTPEEKNRISHRGLAVRKFAAILKEMLENP